MHNNVSKSPAATLPAPQEGTPVLGSWSIPNFRWLLSGSVLSNAAGWIQGVTLSWLVFNLTGSGTMLGSINLVRTIASVCIVPLAGLLVDRFSRRMLITLENGFLFLFTLALGLIILFGHSNLWFLFIFAFISGMFGTIDTTLRQVMIFDLVPRSMAPNAVALIQTGWSIMRVVGPSVGGFLILWVGAGTNFLVQAGTFVLVAITILQIKFPGHRSNITHRPAIQDIKESLRYITRNRLTRTFMMMGVIMPLLTIPIFSILPPIYAVQVFGDKSGKVLGLLMSAAGMGGIIGGLLTAYLGRFEYRGRLQLLSLFLLSMSLMAFAFSSHLVLALLCLTSAGFFEMIFLATNSTLLQLSIPDNLRAQVTALITLTGSLSPLGGMLAGVGSDLLGGPKTITIILTSVAAGVALLVLLASSTVRNYRMSLGIAPIDASEPKP